MIRTDAWQRPTIAEIQNTLMANRDVLALAVFGSALELDGPLDEWSDVDLLLVVADDAYAKFYPRSEWIPTGEIFASQQSENPYHATTRICLTDLRRLDLVITTESRLQQLPDWNSIPFWRGKRILFSRSAQVAALLKQSQPSPEPVGPSQADFEKMANHFWFKAMLASYKVVRNDRLIALHLALDLVRDCCVLGMMLRDRVEATNVHREGDVGNELVDKLATTSADYTATGILQMIEQSAFHFDQLAAEWSPDYQEHRGPLLEWLEHIRRTGHSWRKSAA